MFTNVVALSALAVTVAGEALLTDISQISQNWVSQALDLPRQKPMAQSTDLHSQGQLSPYTDNPENFFGVEITGLPDGCQVEQAHTLQRHAQRFPTGAGVEGTASLF